MTDTAFLKPAAPHLVVRDPETRQLLAADGEPKPLSTYWCRRLRDGDVVVVVAMDAAALQTAFEPNPTQA